MYSSVKVMCALALEIVIMARLSDRRIHSLNFIGEPGSADCRPNGSGSQRRFHLSSCLPGFIDPTTVTPLPLYQRLPLCNSFPKHSNLLFYFQFRRHFLSTLNLSKLIGSTCNRISFSSQPDPVCDVTFLSLPKNVFFLIC